MDLGEYAALVAEQSGVISRRQLAQGGASRHDVARLLRRRELAQIHRGVYVNHTGPTLWLQRAWAAVLFCWPAALSHSSALRANDAAGEWVRAGDQIHVVVDPSRHFVGPEGIEVHRLKGFREQVLWQFGPPRVRYERAVIDVAATASDEMAAFAVVAQACQSRRTTAGRLLDHLADRGNLARRQWLVSVLGDVAEGTCSVLEHGFLHRVVRAHGLQMPDRQVRSMVAGRATYRDAEWAASLVIELDGRLFHGTAVQRDRDFDRDLSAASEGQRTVRLSYGQVFERSCQTAKLLVATLQAAGVEMAAQPCGPNCSL